MHGYPLKLFILISFCFVFGSNLVSAQIAPSNLKVADSLFSQNKFTESFDLYEQLLETHQQSSPQMLLKMAFIKEGLKDHSKALYYLNLYYLQTTDKKVLKKMEELAKNHDLTGYEYSDWEFFMMLYRKYNGYITYILLALALLLFAVVFRQKKRYNKKPVTVGFLLTFILAILFYHINFSDNYHKGIIVQANAYLMDAPSSGADLVSIVDKGHRVKVMDKKDVWVEIEWEGHKAYIRENNIATLH